jgi:alkanesulfonate monooxygenase SsuD/methylene tetrahydromethanopterin reductase-like flavin-dependent oxidoreductase (luciferase family)
MRIGFALPQVGSNAGPEALVRVARRAEELGFDSLWVLDRILFPVHPRLPYPIEMAPCRKSTSRRWIPWKL